MVDGESPFDERLRDLRDGIATILSNGYTFLWNAKYLAVLSSRGTEVVRVHLNSGTGYFSEERQIELVKKFKEYILSKEKAPHLYSLKHILQMLASNPGKYIAEHKELDLQLYSEKDPTDPDTSSLITMSSYGNIITEDVLKHQDIALLRLMSIFPNRSQWIFSTDWTIRKFEDLENHPITHRVGFLDRKDYVFMIEQSMISLKS